MRKKWVNILALVVLLAIFASSISIENLDEVKARGEESSFDAPGYAEKFWQNDLLPNLDEALEINQLFTALEDNPEQTFDKYSNALGIGNIRFFMVKGQGEVIEIEDNHILVNTISDSSSNNYPVRIAIEYIFGNAVRDASGKISLSEFEQTMDFNMVSAEINKLIRKEVIPQLKNEAKEGRLIEFTGAIEMNKKQVDLGQVEIIPVHIEYSSKTDSNE